MENAWLGVRLEGSYAHPLNRGWMSVFRRWANSEVFREHWLTLRGEYSQDFVRFCERALRLDHGQPRAFPMTAGQWAGVEGWKELRDEFHTEWPDEKSLDDRAGEANALAAHFDNHPAVWLLAAVPAADPQPQTWTPDKYPCGVVSVWPLPDLPGRYGLLVWLRGAFRNLGIGRECLNELFEKTIVARLAQAPGTDKEIEVRFPGAGRPHGADGLQKEIWLTFFFHYQFRKAEDPTGPDLVLRRPVVTPGDRFRGGT
jgi:hypothetical protein